MFVTMMLALIGGDAFAGDKDKDGISNKVDVCKLEPEDKDGFEDEDGCPDPDNDADKILDGDDKCPDEAEDKDGFEDEDGCPDPDNDGDGVLDADDKCDGEMETDDDKDGCPTVDYTLINENGWVSSIQVLTDDLSAALNKQAEGCDEAAKKATDWLGENDAKELHGIFKARLARAADTFDPSTANDTLAAQGSFWSSAGELLGLYCKESATWKAVAPKVDAVYAMTQPPAAE